jgi:4-amino-4-deoxychorismate lyase
MFIYFNGEFIHKDEVRISPYDHGFLYGIGLFETFRIYNGHPFLLDDHLERLNDGLKQLKIMARFQREEIREILSRLLMENALENAYIRLNVSAGTGDIGLRTAEYLNPNLLIFAKPLPPAGDMAEKRVQTLSLPRNTPEGTERLKSHHYLNNIFAKQEIGEVPDLEGVFLTKEGFLAEGIVSNLFWVRGQALYTPSLETGILNGITRQFVIAMARTSGLEIREGLYREEEAESAEELFLTNSIQEIVGVNSYKSKAFPGKEGPVAKELFKRYGEYRTNLWSRNEL